VNVSLFFPRPPYTLNFPIHHLRQYLCFIMPALTLPPPPPPLSGSLTFVPTVSGRSWNWRCESGEEGPSGDLSLTPPAWFGQNGDTVPIRFRVHYDHSVDASAFPGSVSAVFVSQGSFNLSRHERSLPIGILTHTLLTQTHAVASNEFHSTGNHTTVVRGQHFEVEGRWERLDANGATSVSEGVMLVRPQVTYTYNPSESLG
jgi:hypothetical protein